MGYHAKMQNLRQRNMGEKPLKTFEKYGCEKCDGKNYASKYGNSEAQFWIQ
jgi:hypothetical protein